MARSDFKDNGSEPLPLTQTTDPTLDLESDSRVGIDSTISVNLTATNIDVDPLNATSNDVTVFPPENVEEILGACCIGEACLDSNTDPDNLGDMTAAKCAELGGVFFPNETCEDDPCEVPGPPVGACCFVNSDTGLMECQDNTTQIFCEGPARQGVWQGADTTCATSNCDDGELRFSIDVDVNGLPTDPESEFDFVPGTDTVNASININTGQISGQPIVRWYLSAEHFPPFKPNIWNTRSVPQFGTGANMDVPDTNAMIVGGTESQFTCSDGFMRSNFRWTGTDPEFDSIDDARAAFEAVTDDQIRNGFTSNLAVPGPETGVVPNTYMDERTKGWVLLNVEQIANMGQVRNYPLERITWFIRGVMRRIVLLREILPNAKFSFWRFGDSYSMADFLQDAPNREQQIENHINNNVFASQVRYDPNGRVNEDGTPHPDDDHSQGKTLYEMLDFLQPVLYQSHEVGSAREERVLNGDRVVGTIEVCDAIRAAHPDKDPLPVVPLMTMQYAGSGAGVNEGDWAGETNAFEMYGLKDYVRHYSFWYPTLTTDLADDIERLNENIDLEIQAREGFSEGDGG